MFLWILSKFFVLYGVILKPDYLSSVIEWFILLLDVFSFGVMGLSGDGVSALAVQAAVHVLGFRGEGFIDVHMYMFIYSIGRSSNLLKIWLRKYIVYTIAINECSELGRSPLSAEHAAESCLQLGVQDLHLAWDHALVQFVDHQLVLRP